MMNQQDYRDYTIILSIKRVDGLGVKWERLGEFRFCALNDGHRASMIAAGNAKVQSVSETVYTQIVNILPCCG